MRNFVIKTYIEEISFDVNDPFLVQKHALNLNVPGSGPWSKSRFRQRSVHVALADARAKVVELLFQDKGFGIQCRHSSQNKILGDLI